MIISIKEDGNLLLQPETDFEGDFLVKFFYNKDLTCNGNQGEKKYFIKRGVTLDIIEGVVIQK